jgi:TonB family protein
MDVPLNADNPNKRFESWRFSMKWICSGVRLVATRRTAVRLMQAAILILTLALAFPASAADRAVKSRVAPLYPEIAKRMKISGEVRLEVTVDPAGTVTDMKLLNGNVTLSSAAMEAVRKWKFAPGADVSTVNVVLNFAL